MNFVAFKFRQKIEIIFKCWARSFPYAIWKWRSNEPIGKKIPQKKNTIDRLSDIVYCAHNGTKYEYNRKSKCMRTTS